MSNTSFSNIGIGLLDSEEEDEQGRQKNDTEALKAGNEAQISLA